MIHVQAIATKAAPVTANTPVAGPLETPASTQASNANAIKIGIAGPTGAVTFPWISPPSAVGITCPSNTSGIIPLTSRSPGDVYGLTVNVTCPEATVPPRPR